MSGLRRHVPELAVDWALDAPQRRWQLIDGTLAFADISGFTALAERLAQRGRMGGEELVETLGRVFGEMLDIAGRRGGTLLKFGGDALLLFFQGDRHALRAACAAVEMRAALREAAKLPTSVGPLRLSMSVGLHSGAVHFFLVGAPHRELVVLGPAANMVVATEGAANSGEVMVSAATATQLPKTALKLRSDGAALLRWRKAPFAPDGAAQPRDVDAGLVAGLFPRQLGAYLAPGAPDPEHRVACIAFIKFSGTDAILDERGPDALAAALDTTISFVSTCLDAAGVTLLAVDIDRDGGKIFIGAGVPYGHEDDEGTMLRALRQIADARLPLTLSIGVNRGHVFAAEIGGSARAAYSAMGDTTNTAARIASKTPIGAIYAHPSVLDQSLTLFATSPAEALVLKGKKVPLVVYAVGDEIGPRRREGLSVETFIGRAAEVETIRAALTDLERGKGSVVHVVGDAGVGKSRLLHEVVQGLDPAAIFSLRAEPYGTNSPYRMFRDPVRGLLRVTRGDPAVMREELLRHVVAADAAVMPFAALLGDVAHIPIDASPEVSAIDPRFRAQRSADVLIQLLATTHSGPRVIAVDDAQWCDEASTQVLERIAAACAERPWLLLVLRRNVEGGFIPSTESEVRLAPMDAATVRALVIAATEAAPLRPHEIEIIGARSGGNPLFAMEIVRAAREVGSLDAVPLSLEAALAARVDALEPSARRVLRYASVLGRSFARHVLANILEAEGHGADVVALSRLDEFLDVDGAERLRFRSGLVRDTTYEGVAYRLRARLHAGAGAAMERLADDPDTIADSLALHFSRAGDYDRAWRYARIAGDRARLAYANADAARLYEMALDAARRTPGADARACIQVWTDLGSVRELAGMIEGSLEAYRRALKLVGDDPVARADLLDTCAAAKDRSGAFVSALRDLTIGRRLVDGLDTVAAARTRARLSARAAMVRFAQDNSQRAFEHARQAIEEARSSGELAALACALQVLELSRIAIEGPGDGRHLREALTIREELGDLHLQAYTRGNLGFVSAHAGRWNEAADWFTSSRDAFERCGDAVSAAFQATNLGEMLVKQRRFDEALPVLTDALRVVRASDWAEGIAMIELQLGRMLIERGDFAAADQMLDRVTADFGRMGKPMYALEAAAARALGQHRAGQSALALELLDNAIAASARSDSASLRPILACTRALACAALGRESDAEREITDGLAAAREQKLPYEEALLLQARCDIARLGNRSPDLESAKAAEQIFDGLGVR